MKVAWALPEPLDLRWKILNAGGSRFAAAGSISGTIHSKTNFIMGQGNWNAELYTGKHQFVARHGEDLLNLVPDGLNRILDLGCGSGELTNLLAEKAGFVMGIDSSEDMIIKARQQFPRIHFEVDSGTTFNAEPFDLIFSNAVFHWIHDQQNLVRNLRKLLKPAGKLVVEFGGIDNIILIRRELHKVLISRKIEINPHSFWFFPSIGEYAPVLEQHGFRIRMMQLFDRLTPLEDVENGIKDWLFMFASIILNDLPHVLKEDIFRETQENLRNQLFIDGRWYADYQRLRVVAEIP
jgi:trans-aconitate methyltransferase